MGGGGGPQDYTVIFWDWGYSLFLFPFPIPIPDPSPSPSRLTIIDNISDTIKHELERNKPLVDRILSDITYQSADNLVEGLTKLEEEGYNYAHYYGAGSQKTYNADYK